jgi:hypothetical protein
VAAAEALFGAGQLAEARAALAEALWQIDVRAALLTDPALKERYLCGRRENVRRLRWRRRGPDFSVRTGHPQSCPMSLDPGYLLASLVVSGVGFVLFSYGRSQKRVAFAVTGLVMLVYPYFVTNIVWMLALVPIFLLLLWFATRMGL